MGNRPINRRPFRRKPWAKAKQRPKRWNASTVGATELHYVEGINIPLETGAALPILTIVSGQVDVEPWADEQEVTLDRVVGSITLYGWHVQDVTASLSPSLPYYKMGLIVNEEVTADASGTTLNLWEQETMEDYEWMWLHAGLADEGNHRMMGGGADPVVMAHSYRVDIDTKNRRKIGQSDELNLYIQWRPTFSLTEQDSMAVFAAVELRTILMSR